MARSAVKPARREPKPPEPVRLQSTSAIGIVRMLPLGHLLLQAAGVIGVAVALALGFPGWRGGAIGLAVALALVFRIRGTALPRLIGLRLGFLRDRRARARRKNVLEPFDAPMSDGALMGFRWDGKTLLSLLKIDENPQALTVLEPGVTVSGEMVPVHTLVDCLEQFDITLDSIDVLSQGARSQGHSAVAGVYEAVLGPLPAIAQRGVWIVIRLDPTRCADAVRRRGGSREGILRAATTATRRVANRLTEAGLRPRILTVSEISQAINQLADGVNLATVEETWRTCREGQFRLRSFAIKPAMLTTAGLGLLWTIPSYSTTVGLSLRRDRQGRTEIRGLARFDTHGRSRVQLRGLTHLRGFQFAALAASLPVPRPRRKVANWAVVPAGAQFHQLAVPASGCGQVIGADERGRAVALPLFGPQIRRVEVIGTLHLVQQAVLRSLALGARVLVHSRRAEKWHSMVEEVDDQDLLWVTDFNRGAVQAGADRNYSVEVFDGVVEQGVRVGVTTMVALPPNTPASSDADVTLHLLDLDTDEVRVSTRTGGSSVVTMVATDEEMRYLKGSFDSAD